MIVLVVKSSFPVAPAIGLSHRQGNTGRLAHTIASVKGTLHLLRYTKSVRVDHSLMSYERIVKPWNRLPCEIALFTRER